MLKQRNEQIQTLVRLTDILVCAVAFFAAFYARFPGQIASQGLGSLGSVSWMLATSMALHLILYPALGFYESLRLKTVTRIIQMVGKAFIIEFFVLGGMVFLVQAKTTSRYFFVLYLAINALLVLAEKLTARVLLSSIRRRGYNFRQILIVGAGSNAARIIQTLQRNRHWGYVPFGVLRAPGDAAEGQDIGGVPILGDQGELDRLVRDRAVDEVYFAPNNLNAAEISQDMALCEKIGIPARFVVNFFEMPHTRVGFTLLDDLPILTYHSTLRTPSEAIVKRAMDLGISLVGLLITAALYPWIARRIRKEAPGPVIFKQVRVGENGRRFKCYKFRTMYVDAEARKGELMAGNLMQGPMFKLENDPRVFPFGAFLRRTSLDELPQFFNILRGDMSVVGTRPPTPDEVAQYETHFRRRLSIRPGLTGLWQVSGRNEIRRFEDILELDLKYIDRWSIWLDLKIIGRTIWVTLFRKGAY